MKILKPWLLVLGFILFVSATTVIGVGVYSNGRTGGQNIRGGTGSGEDLTLSSTTHGTKGSIFFGTNSAYDEVTNRLGLKTTIPETTLHIKESDTGVNIASLGSQFTIEANYYVNMSLIHGTGDSATINFGSSGASTNWRIVADGTNLDIGYGSNAVGITIDSSQNIQFDNYTAGFLQTDGSGNVSASVNTTSWTAPTFENGWVNFGAPVASAGYRKDAMGVVWLQGAVASGTIGASAFTLPVGYRPNAKLMFGTTGASGANPTRTDILSNGGVNIVIGNTGYHSLNGISFLAE